MYISKYLYTGSQWDLALWKRETFLGTQLGLCNVHSRLPMVAQSSRTETGNSSKPNKRGSWAIDYVGWKGWKALCLERREAIQKSCHWQWQVPWPIFHPWKGRRETIGLCVWSRAKITVILFLHLSSSPLQFGWNLYAVYIKIMPAHLLKKH